MKINTLHLVYFSPSGSTEKIVKRIAAGIKGAGLEVIAHDMLRPESRSRKYIFKPDDLVIFGSMTAGMLFTKVSDIFDCMSGNDTPFIGVVSYGNTYYGIALSEMKKRAEARGFKVAALGAFPAAHSIDKSIAQGRPDEQDYKIIDAFGKSAYEKIIQGNYELAETPGTGWAVPELDFGNKVIAYREAHPDEPYALPQSFKTKSIDADTCIKCGTCVSHCPADAIDLNANAFDLDKCIACWGCINRCPKHAISSTSSEMQEIMAQLKDICNNRLEPKIYI